MLKVNVNVNVNVNDVACLQLSPLPHQKISEYAEVPFPCRIDVSLYL